MQVSLKCFTTRIVTDLRQVGRYSVTKTYLSAMRGLVKSAGNNDLTFAELTPAMMVNFQHGLITNSRSKNTVSLYLRALRSICNQAAEQQVAEVPSNLFDTVFTGYVPVRHRAVSTEVINRIEQATFKDKDQRLNFAKDMFMLSFYFRGIPFIDLAHLRKCDFKDGFITYQRSKTGRQACLYVEPKALDILNRYMPNATETSYLLPIIRHMGSIKDEKRRYESALRLYNKHLAKVSEKLELGVKLTSYVPRHSWATIAHDIGVDVADISEALCHSSEKMTRNYLRSFSPDRLASVNRKVMEAISGFDTTKIKGGKRKGKKGIPKEFPVPVLCKKRNETTCKVTE